MKLGILLILAGASALNAQANTWSRHSAIFTGGRPEAALTYHADGNRLLLTLGYQTPDSTAYSEVMYSPAVGKWINFFPDSALYGIWGDSTGAVRNLGRTGNATFGSPYFIFKNIAYNGINYLRPCLAHYRTSNVFGQYAVNTDNGRIYYYVDNKTFSYDPNRRVWDTLPTSVHPSKIAGSPNAFSLRWGTLCYDPVNKEMLLTGGGGLDTRDGSNGSWVFSVASGIWTKLTGTQPEPRAHAAMAYDASARKIVLFGGDHLDFLYSDTWVYDCATRTWQKKSPVKSPRPRAGHAMVYLNKQGRIALFGGYEYTSCSSFTVCGVYRNLPEPDLWVYNTAAGEWKLVKTFSGEPFPVFIHGHNIRAVSDTGDNIFTLGTKDTVWRMSCDVGVTDDAGTLVKGVGPDSTLYRAGPWRPAYFDEGLAAPDTAANEAALRNVPDNVWTNIVAPKRPRGNRDWGTTCLDSAGDRIIKYSGGHSAHCGTDVAVYTIHDNRWHLSFPPEYPLDYIADAAAPGNVSFGGNPWTTHSYDRYDFDPRINKLVHVRNYYTYFFDPDKMAWDTTRLRNPADMTSSGYYLSHTRTPHGMICWAARGASTTQTDLYRLDTDSMKWTKLPATGPALINNYSDASGSVYDSKRDRLLLVRSTTNGNPVMQAYDFATGAVTAITPVNNASISGSDHFRENAYFPELDMVLFAAQIGGQNLFYDCAANSWKLLAIPKGAGVTTTDTRSTGFMYDARRKLIWDSETNCQTYTLRLTTAFAAKEARPLLPADAFRLTVMPNPLASNGRVAFALPVASNVTLAVLTMTGQRVRTLVSRRHLQAGMHGVGWDGRDENGGRLAAGAYLIHFSAGTRELTVRAGLVR